MGNKSVELNIAYRVWHPVFSSTVKQKQTLFENDLEWEFLSEQHPIVFDHLLQLQKRIFNNIFVKEGKTCILGDKEPLSTIAVATLKHKN